MAKSKELSELASILTSVADGTITFDAKLAGTDGSAPSDFVTKSQLDAAVQAQDNTDEITEGSTNLYYTDARVQSKLGNVSGHIIPDTNITYDLGSDTNRFRDIYLSGNTIVLGDATISSDGNGSIVLPADSLIGDAQLPPVNLTIAPEVLEIQVASPEAGDDITWFWTWLQSTLPYARATITNSPQLTVPLYKKGTYTINNYAGGETFGEMTQTHHATLKWVEGAGHDNDVTGWVTYTENVTTSHPDINGGNPTLVSRINVSVPEVFTVPETLNLPQNIGYDVSFTRGGVYTFGANMMHGGDVSSVAEGDNPNIGPMYRGATYTFHLDSSLSGHPFYITTDNGQGFIAGQYVGEYTDGVVGSRNNGSEGQETLTFTVPLDAPDTLYYQCAFHQPMRGVITVKDLAVEVNNNGNYVLYFQHTHEGHKTPIEIRPIPSLVNQMCLVYDQSTGTFVPQDLATYVENTPSFKNKIQEVAGTATLVDATGEPIVATVKIFTDAAYLPFSGNRAGDIAYTQDNNTLFIWDEVVYNWVSTKVQSTTELAEGSNLYFTDARVGTYLSNNGFDTAANIVASIVDTAPATLDTLNELAAALGDDPNYATTISTALGTKLASADFDSTFDTRLATKDTDSVAEGTNLYYTDARAQAAITVNTTLSKSGGQISMPASGVTAGSYGSASTVPVITVDAQGRITSATTTNVAGVSGFSYTAATNTFTITTSAGTSFDAVGDLSSFDTDDLTEGSTNLYWTTARGESMFDTHLATKDTDDLTEGSTNLYYTDARARASISATGSISYDSSTGIISYTQGTTDTVAEGSTNLYYTTARANSDFDTRLATKSTTDVAEGTNLYWTTARGESMFDTRLATKSTTDVAEGTNLYYTEARVDSNFATKDTDDLTEGSTNLYWTTTRGESMFDTRLATKDTDDLTEGTNLYYTDARARASISATGSLSYNSTTGVISFTQGTTDTVSEGSTNLYFTTARAQGAISTSGGLLTYGSGVVGLTSEAIQDVIGAMVSNNNESAISVTYNDAGNVLDFAVDTTTIATRTYVDDAIAALIDSAPGTLTTLSEIAAALGDDPNFASTITTQLATKADKATAITAGTGLSGGGYLSNSITISHADTSSQVSIDNSGNTFIQDITLDGFGHITAMSSATVVVGDGAMTVTAGSGLTGGGQLGTANQSGASSVTISHADTSSQASVDNSNGTVIQDITLDTYGHITAIGSVDLDGRYYTETEADSRFVNVTGDTMTGNLILEDSELHVGDTSTDSWTRIKHAQVSGYGFTIQHNNATVLVNEQGTTNEALILGDVDVGDNSGLFGIAHSIDGGTVWTKKLDLRGNGELYIGSAGTSRVFHDAYHPNADTWTTARTNTVTLTGDVTGSGNASVDGSGNWTVSLTTTVADDSHNHDGRYYTETEADSRFVNVTGDTMTGNLTTSGNISATSGRLVLRDDSIENHATATNTAGIAINYYGYQSGTTYSRDFSVYDGKGSLRFKTYGADNYSYAVASMRSPIFYDSDDTGYYVNPNSTSKLNSIVDARDNSYIARRHSGSDFPNGTLVQTNIPATAASGDSFILECVGKSYQTGNPPFDFKAQGYLYSSTIINYSGVSNGAGLSYLKFFEYNGYLCAWWPRFSYWNSFDVIFRTAGGSGDSINRITSITDSALPAGNKMVQVNFMQSALYGANIGNRSGLYATIYYDGDNTSYYTDPASTSVLNNVTINGTLSANGIVQYYQQSSNPGAVADGSIWNNTATGLTYQRQVGVWVQFAPGTSGTAIFDVNGTRVN